MRGTLEKEITSALTIAKQKQKILDNSKNNKVVSYGDLGILNQEIFISSEMLALILEAKSASGNRIYSPFILYKDKQIEEFHHYLNQLEKENKEYRYDCIYRKHDGHCTTVQQEFIKGKRYIFNFDAAGDISNASLIVDSSSNAQIYNYSGAVQKDHYSCAIFAVQALNTMSKMSSTSKIKSFTGQWFDLDPRLLKNSQGLFPIEEYKAYYAWKNRDTTSLSVGRDKVSIQSYIAKYSIFYRDLDNIFYHQQNRAIDYKTYKYLLKAETLLNCLSDEALNIVINNRTSFVANNALEISHEKSHSLEYLNSSVQKGITISK